MSPTLRDRISIAAKALFSSQPTQDVGAAMAELVSQRHTPPERGTKQMLEAYSTMPWLRGVVHRVAEDVSAVRWSAYAVRDQRGRVTRNRAAQKAGYDERKDVLRQLAEQDELEEVTEHPFRELMDRSDPTATGKVITGKMRRKLLVEHIELTGDGFWLLERNEAEVPNLAWPVPPHWVQELPDPDDLTFHVEFGSWRGDIPVSEVYWVSDADPANPYVRGKGTAQALADELETDEYAAKTAKQAFFNRGRPDFIASWGGPKGKEGSPPGEAALRRKQAEWMNRHGGFWRQFKPHFTNHEVDIHELSQSFEQLQLRDLREWQRDVIRQVWGVPAEIMGDTGDSNRATSYNARRIYATQVQVPRLELMRETLQELAEREYDERIVIDYDSPVPEDREFKKDLISETPWAFRADEIREVGEFGRLPDDTGEVHMVPFNLDATEELTGASRPEEGRRRSRTNGGGRRTKQEGPENEFWRRIHRIAEEMEPEVRERFEEAIRKTRSEVDIDALEDALRAANNRRAYRALNVERLSELMGEGGEQEIQRAIQRAHHRAAEAAAEALSARTGTTISFDQTNRRAVRWIREHSAGLVQNVTEESRAAIQSALQRSFEEGIPPDRTARELAEELRDTIGLTERQEGAVRNLREALEESGELDPGEIEDRVAEYRDAKLRHRAEVITRNETLTASNQGQQRLWQQAASDGDIDASRTRRVWIVTPDDRLCPICAPMAGQRRRLEEAFVSPFNGDEVLEPPIHVQCRCAMGIVFDGGD